MKYYKLSKQGTVIDQILNSFDDWDFDTYPKVIDRIANPPVMSQVTLDGGQAGVATWLTAYAEGDYEGWLKVRTTGNDGGIIFTADLNPGVETRYNNATKIFTLSGNNWSSYLKFPENKGTSEEPAVIATTDDIPDETTFVHKGTSSIPSNEDIYGDKTLKLNGAAHSSYNLIFESEASSGQRSKTYLSSGTSVSSSPESWYIDLPAKGTSSSHAVLATTDYIIANPSSTTATLTGITIGDTSYAVSGGNDNDHYPTTFTWTNGTTAGPTGSLTGNSGFTAVSFGAIPSASSDQSGIITTSTQTFAGSKTFNSKVVIGKSSLSSPTTVLDVGKTSYGGGFTFRSAGVGNPGYLAGQFSSGVHSFPYITNISRIIFHQGSSTTQAEDAHTIILTSPSQPTANQTLTLPDKSGELAIIDDIPAACSLYRHSITLKYNDTSSVAKTIYFMFNSSSSTAITTFAALVAANRLYYYNTGLLAYGSAKKAILLGDFNGQDFIAYIETGATSWTQDDYTSIVSVTDTVTQI